MYPHLYDEVHPSMVIDIPPGMMITHACEAALEAAERLDHSIGFIFNTVFVRADPWDSCDQVCRRYDEGMARLRAART